MPATPVSESSNEHTILQLDGLRAVAVSAVLLFHADQSWMPGGYLGVSLFFTLSGFVVTTSLIRREPHSTSKRGLIGSFYCRRIKRLWPASTLTIGAVLVAAASGVFRVSSTEVVWTSLHGANWFHLHTGGGYAAAVTGSVSGRSPLLHFWSLAIEEQFYLLWPIAFVALIGFGLKRLLIVTASMYALGTAALLTFGADVRPEFFYYSTVCRFLELLAGCVAALALAAGWRPSKWFAQLATPAMLAMVVLFAVTPNAPDAWPYQGRLPVFAALAAVLIVALLQPGWLSNALASRVPVAIGRISYGLYLVHWPIFVAFESNVVRLVVTVGAAVALRLVVEVPVQRRPIRPRRVAAFGAAGLISVVAMAVVLLAPPPIVVVPVVEADVIERIAIPSATQPVVTTSTAPVAASAPTMPTSAQPTPTSAPPTTAEPPAAEPLRVLIFGDSTAISFGNGVATWAASLPDQPVQLSIVAGGGCGVVAGGEYQQALFNAGLQVVCEDLRASAFPDELQRARPDVVIVLVTLADTWKRSWDGGDTWLRPGDDEFALRIAHDYTTMFEQSLEVADTVMWIRPPAATDFSRHPPDIEDSFENGDQEVIEAIVGELALAHPGRVVVGDLRTWFESAGLADSTEARPDGIHLSLDAAIHIADEWLAHILWGVAGSGPRGGGGESAGLKS